MQSIAFSASCVSDDDVRSRHRFSVPVVFGVGVSVNARAAAVEALAFAFGMDLTFGVGLAFEVVVINGCCGGGLAGAFGTTVSGMTMTS